MEKEEYRKHFELEDEHWWFAGRRAIILQTIAALKSPAGPMRLLDAGCGTGFTLKILAGQGAAFGFDLHREAITFCRRRGLNTVVLADAQAMPFQRESFDVVLFLDVLYHLDISSDLLALENAHRVLKPGGHLVLTDSAFRFLWSRHDLAVHARERYTRRKLRRRVEDSGFQVTAASYFQFFLFIPVLFLRLLERRRKGKDRVPVSDLKSVNRTLNKVLFQIFRVEAGLLPHIRFPFGSSLLLLARKV
jgi:SAM-dependent methyltransferase